MNSCAECEEVKEEGNEPVLELNKEIIALKCDKCSEVKEIGWIERYSIEEDVLIIYDYICTKCPS